MLRWLKIALLVAIVGFGALLLYGYGRNHPEDMPWTPLDLAQPVGAFTGRKLVGLRDQPALCRALLGRSGVRYTALAPREGAGRCGYRDGVRLDRGGATRIALRPAGLATSCPVAAALALWEWHVVQRAALEHLGTQVATIDHFGSYNCRRIYGRTEGAWSEHSTANAIDVAGFRLDDGRRVTVLRDWQDKGAKGRFLRAVRDGACDLFATVLSPDYNAAHRDHLHLDQAARGKMGWRGCR
ncbi:extensin family protein [Sphingosinicella sp. BN140058]|uniref:extensin-like domain-containing protein n=1 Tax=Sphingosinicella sp. BN140058 TaxID=1892855 RepID=UPI0010123E2B|nr:extensin family protein [Sphingosinicella sp. BN140058]QAY78480.1 extensin family protein [Sphingosinicella sp. BN140058]